jgi:excisionase family DNA binding protein
MTVAEAARELEMSVGTVYALCATGDLSHHRVGPRRGRIRIDREDIAAYRAKTRVAGPAGGTVVVPAGPGAIPDFFNGRGWGRG